MGVTSERHAWRSAYTRYTNGAILLHWTIAFLILLNIAGGLLMTSDLLPKSVQFPTYQWHKTIGLLVLALTVARILWRVMNPPPAHAPTMPRAERLASHAVHLLFYGLMLAVPLIGWLVVSASSAVVPTHLFMLDALPWPNLPIRGVVAEATRETLEGIFEFSHKWLALSFLALLALHVAGALKHRIVDQLPSFSRMGLGDDLVPQQSRAGARLTAFVGLAAVLGLGLLIGRAETVRSGPASGVEGSSLQDGAISPAAQPSADQSAAVTTQAEAIDAADGGWLVDRAQSSLGFEAGFSGTPVKGDIGDYTADITFSPDALETANAEIVMRTASITVDNSFVSPQLQGTDGFASDTHPEARLVLSEFRKDASGDDAYTASGTLTLKGETRPIVVPFTFEPLDAERASVTGSAVIDRTAFGIGVSNDPTGSELSKEVTVNFTLAASRAKP
ncbi:cytochrome b/b6 domain-containing protein [Fulvimarina sp. 2208YS6-2-32]|uniref:Cytochrome b/b6 domain-containing protein n=1 Tax=Fulvimarina uroteuthidis TaxID=3098149 RepID=A0ABU5I0M6_9HYPH|nr:cytochrome b/b6 domain-containing protein [Fulvimarina sp. 2208YS6-2-32]MDY8108930.1 cytochrome b/b6 domain-containing protein [Fulvimarina sp. 2208YS6-2-32]